MKPGDFVFLKRRGTIGIVTEMIRYGREDEPYYKIEFDSYSQWLLEQDIFPAKALIALKEFLE